MRFLRQHPLALVVLAGLLAGGLAIAVAQPPDNTEPQDFHGRTWLTASAKGGDQLVLVNGISGLIEGRSQGGATIPDGARFIDSTPTSTLVGSGDGVTVVDSGTQEAVTKPGVNGDRSALTDDLVVTLGRDVRVRPASLTGRVRAVPGAPTPVADTAPVVDASDAAWYLGRSETGLVAVELSGSAPTIEEHDVDRTTTRLLVVDGSVYAAGPKAIEQVDGDGSRTVAARSDVLPSVAVASGDLWASAEGRTITVFDGDDERTVRTSADVTDLAVWHGDVVAATAKGAERIEGDRVERIRSIRSRATIHADGGMLWLTSRGDVVAIDRDQQQSRFRLRALDADLCIETCDAGDLAQLLKDQPTPTTQPEAEHAPTTTTPPRDLQAPSTEPELPTTTTTTTPTTTTEPRAPSTTIERSPRNTTTTTTEPKRTTTTVRPRPTTPQPPPTLPPPTQPLRTQPPRTQPPSTRPPQTRPPQTRPPQTRPPETVPPPTPPPVTRPPWTPPTRPPNTPPSTSPNTPPSTPPTEPPEEDIRYLPISISTNTSTASASVAVGVTGSARACVPAGLLGGGTVTWSGATNGSSPVGLRWSGLDDTNPATQPESVQINNLRGGELTVQFNACGRQDFVEKTVNIDLGTPSIDPITVSPNPPPENQPFTVTATIRTPGGWNVTGGDWNGSGAGSSCTTDNATKQIDNARAVATFQAHQAGPCHISLVVTFAPPGGGQPLRSDQAADVNVAPTTAPGAPAPAPRRAPAQIEGTKPTG